MSWAIVRNIDDADCLILETRAAEAVESVYGSRLFPADVSACVEIDYRLDEGGLSQIERGRRDALAERWAAVLRHLINDERPERIVGKALAYWQDDSEGVL